ncbi:unnamed protein product, partial [Rotaria sp. Silwood1]
SKKKIQVIITDLKINRNPITHFNNPNDPTAASYTSRWFGENNIAPIGFQKGFLNTPGTTTAIGSTTRTLFGGARSGAGIFYGMEYTAAGAGNLVTWDTATGTITTVGALAGLAAGHTVTGMAWDKTTSTMFGLSTNGTVSTLYTINLATGALTTVAASMSGSALAIDIAINNSGVMYSCDIGTDVLNLVNKTTGACTSVGSLGINLNFAQGMAFDGETDSLFLAAYTTTGQLYRCNTSTGATTLIGAFGAASMEIDCFIIPSQANRQLNAFNLQTPVASTRIVTAAGSSTPITITWDTSGAGATYKFIFGTALPTRRLTINANANAINTTLGALDAILASNGFTNNGTATDSAVGQWDVWAFKGAGAPGVDSLKSTNGPRAITFRRQQVALTPFALLIPTSGTTIITSPINPAPVSVTWGASGSGATYNWLFKLGATYTDPATVRLQADGSGFTNSLTMRNSQLDSLLATLGVAPGDSAVGTWRVRAYTSTDSLNSTAPDRALTLRRTGLLPLSQDFTDPSFPPPFWSYTGTGTVYWTRQTVSGYGSGTGSARYNMWSASAGTTQSITSNTFPAVTGPNNYLRFNYSHGYYLSTGVLAADSMGVYTSTNGGTTFSLLIMLKANTTPQLGVNSSNNLSTAASQSQFTPTAGQWATKIFTMPVGTNKVMFTGYSVFGNDAFIDDITSGPATGLGTPISLIPEKFELNQNYPNPFNPTTKINFSLPKSAFVTLKVYDMLGKEVAQLVNQELTANNYSFDFNAAALSSGVYFYKLESAEFTDSPCMKNAWAFLCL